jgi:hypothetical protein
MRKHKVGKRYLFIIEETSKAGPWADNDTNVAELASFHSKI